MNAKQIPLPFQGTGEATSPNSLFSITNTGDGVSILGRAPTGYLLNRKNPSTKRVFI